MTLPTLQACVFTMGYEGLTIDDFIGRLKSSGVETVLDVRELPLSRKKGFSKTAFRDKLGEHGISYLHIPALGCPKPIRNQYKADGNWQIYTDAFMNYVGTQDAALRAVVTVARARASCLVCFEADFSTCHRTYVARAMHEQGGPHVMHITGQSIVQDEPRKYPATS